MSEPLEHAYFNWLCAKVVSINTPNPFYFKMLRVLHNTEFVWVVPGDSHRAEDGLELRYSFLRESGLEEDPEWRALGCSVFEMLVAFSRRCWFQTEIDPKTWFWEFMQNLGLDEMPDSTNPDPVRISNILERFIWRTYQNNGNQGGLFPIRKAKRDQRDVELWYQFFDYLESTDRILE